MLSCSHIILFLFYNNTNKRWQIIHYIGHVIYTQHTEVVNIIMMYTINVSNQYTTSADCNYINFITCWYTHVLHQTIVHVDLTFSNGSSTILTKNDDLIFSDWIIVLLYTNTPSIVSSLSSVAGESILLMWSLFLLNFNSIK